MIPRRPISPLFPYTTLFRSRSTMAISPDGTRIVFHVGRAGVAVGLATRRMDEAKSVILPGTEDGTDPFFSPRSEEHTSELQSQSNLVCRLLLEKKQKQRRSC